MSANDKRIGELLVRVDFEKIRRAMQAVGWKWDTGGRGRHFPCKDELAEMARDLLVSVTERGNVRASCGGFVAENNYTSLRLMFAVVEVEEGEE